MPKRSLSLLLSVLLVHALGFTSLANDSAAESSKRAMLASKVKAGVARLGTGASSRVRVVLYDKTSYDGYISEIGEDHFVVTDAKTGATAPIDYREVKGIKGNNLSAGAKIGIGVAIVAAVGIVAAIVASSGDDREVPRDPQCIRAPCP